MLPKLSFPRFSGEDPTIWLDKCLDYFQFYKVKECLWVTAASMHMDGNAAKWLQMYKLKEGLDSWPRFSQAVKAKFGTYEYSKVMYDLLHIRQKGSVQEYIEEFEKLKYAAAMQNPASDEVLFVTQFVKGLKPEIQDPVLSQGPLTVDRAAHLALLQQDMQEKRKFKPHKNALANKSSLPNKVESKPGTTHQELSKERQLSTAECTICAMPVERNGNRDTC